MDIVFEIILELLIEGGEEICANKKISKWIRYPILFVIVAFFCMVVFGIIFVGISILKTNILAGLILLIIGLVMFVGVIFKFKKYYNEKVDKD